MRVQWLLKLKYICPLLASIHTVILRQRRQGRDPAGNSSCADRMTRSLVHVESYEARLVQLLPQGHLHMQVVVDEEAHWVVVVVVVVVRVVLIVWCHEAIRAHLVAGVQSSQQHHSSC